jgi:sulfonate dioxygenase
MASASVQAPPLSLGGAVGAYKDFQILNPNHEKEITGTDTYKPASFPHYLPVWDNEKGVK